RGAFALARAVAEQPELEVPLEILRIDREVAGVGSRRGAGAPEQPSSEPPLVGDDRLPDVVTQAAQPRRRLDPRLRGDVAIADRRGREVVGVDRCRVDGPLVGGEGASGHVPTLPRWKNAGVRVTAKVDYAVRASIVLARAARDGNEPVKGERIRTEQDI